VINKLRALFSNKANSVKHTKSKKIFCLGFNKTGTTSMAKLFSELDIPVGPQRPAELLINDWKNDNFKSILRYVKYEGVAFQDVPFSLKKLYPILDKEFPDSKFILTIRDSPEQWYKSLTSFHAKNFGKGKIPDKKTLQESTYVYKGWLWEVNRAVSNTPENDVYNKDLLIKLYNEHNASVINYFKNTPEKLLVVNLTEPNAAITISKFLDRGKIIETIPWENKT